MYEIAAMLPRTVAIRGLLKIKIKAAKSRIVVLRKKGTNAYDLSD